MCKPVSDEELVLMALIDHCHLRHPYYGSRRIRGWLEDQGDPVKRRRGTASDAYNRPAGLYPKRNLSLANQAHQVTPACLGI